MKAYEQEHKFSLTKVLNQDDVLFNYVDLLFDQVNHKGIDSLDDPQRAIALVFQIQPLVGYGGLMYYYQHDNKPDKAARAFRLLGFDEAAQALERSASVFPNGILAGDHSSLISWAEEHYEKFKSLWDDLDMSIITLHPSLEGNSNKSPLLTKTREYIANHQNQFNFSK